MKPLLSIVNESKYEVRVVILIVGNQQTDVLDCVRRSQLRQCMLSIYR